MSKRFNVKDELEKLYIEIPKALLYEPKYKPDKETGSKGLSNDAKLLYGILLDRTYLSRHTAIEKSDSTFIDENGDIFIYFETASIEEILNVGTKKAIATKKELIKYNLLEEIKIGQGKGNRLYLNIVETDINNLQLYTSTFLNKVKEKKKNEENRIANLRKNKKATSVENTLYCQKESTSTVKKEVQVLSKRQRSNTDLTDSYSSDPEVFVVVNKSDSEEKKYKPKSSSQFYDIQNDNSLDTKLKVLQLSSKVYMTPDTISVLHNFIDSNILVSEKQIKLLNNMSRTAVEKAIETTVAQNGKSFSYFFKVYKSKEQEEIEELVSNLKDDFIPNPVFEPTYKDF